MKSSFKRISLLLSIITILSINLMGSLEVDAQEINHLNETENVKIKKLIEEKMSEGNIPGLSLTIVKNDKTVYLNGFGYADINEEKTVTSKSLFELASNSKAFTSLALLNLESSGQINLSDPVTKYIPWLKVKYQGKETPITIEQTLHQTNGIPPSTINMIPISNEDSALEETVRTLIGVELDSDPGEIFQYATINYDILGLIIEKVTGNTYENYINETILKPMELNSTHLFRYDAKKGLMTSGYKTAFLKPRLYEAPIYRGNKPAGYIISSGEDMAKWLKIQMNTMDNLDFDYDIIKKTHQANDAVDVLGDNVLYAGGWFLEPNEQITHDGMNPNYSSYITFNKKEKIGIAVLSNLSSIHTQNLGLKIYEVLNGEVISNDIKDSNQYLDKIAFSIIIILSIIILVVLFFIIRVLKKIIKKQIHFKFNGIKSSLKLSLSLVIMMGLTCFIYSIPHIILNGMSWGTVFVWSPASIQVTLYLFYLLVWFIYIFFILKIFFKKE